MGWVRISDDYYDHAKFTATGPLEHALWLAGMAWCNRNLTDGVIPRSAVLRFIDWESVMDVLELVVDSNAASNAVTNGWGNRRVAEVVAARLVKAGLWTETPTGYEVHDYLQYQRSAAQITEAARANAARQQRFRDRHKGQESNGESNGVTNGGVTTPPNPNPNSKKRTTSSSARAKRKPASTAVSDDGTKVSTQDILAKYIEGCKQAPPTDVTARLGAEIKRLIGQDFRPEDITAGLELWATKDLSPGLLSSIVNGVVNRRPRAPESSRPPGPPLPGSGVWDRPVAIGDNE